MNINLYNVLMLGIGFMFLFTAFLTMGNIEQTVLVSLTKDDSSFTGDGYISLCIVYVSFAVCNWFAPSFISFSGPRIAMWVGAPMYAFFYLAFIFPSAWLLYLVSAILGMGGSILWAGQGNYLSRCSDETTISRNSGLFWALLQCSMFFGNLFVYFQFKGQSHIDPRTRIIVVSVLLSLTIFSIFILALLRKPVQEKISENVVSEERQHCCKIALFAFKEAGKLFITKNMLLLSVLFLYTGLVLSFFSGVYGSCIAFTLKIHETPKEIVGLIGISIGVGEILAGAIFGIFGKQTGKRGRHIIVVSGLAFHIVTFILVLVNIPNKAPFGDTTDISLIDPPQIWIALVAAFLLGFGDACINTQIYSMLGGVYAEQSVGAFSLFKFNQCVSAAASFFYSSYLGLYYQILILIIFGILGTICFVIVECSVRKKAKEAALNEKVKQ